MSNSWPRGREGEASHRAAVWQRPRAKSKRGTQGGGPRLCSAYADVQSCQDAGTVSGQEGRRRGQDGSRAPWRKGRGPGSKLPPSLRALPLLTPGWRQRLQLKDEAVWSRGSLMQTQFSSAQSCPTVCNPMNRSTPGFPVHHQLPEFTQTHDHRVSDAIQPSHPLLSPSPLSPNPSQHQSLFQ